MAFMKNNLSGFGSVQSMASPYILSKLMKPNITIQIPKVAVQSAQIQPVSNMPQTVSITDESIPEAAHYPVTSLPPSVNQPMTSSDYVPTGDGSEAPSMDTSATPAGAAAPAAPDQATQPDFIDKVASTFNTSRSTAMVGSIGAAVILGMLLLGRRG